MVLSLVTDPAVNMIGIVHSRAYLWCIVRGTRKVHVDGNTSDIDRDRDSRGSRFHPSPWVAEDVKGDISGLSYSFL